MFFSDILFDLKHVWNRIYIRFQPHNGYIQNSDTDKRHYSGEYRRFEYIIGHLHDV